MSAVGLWAILQPSASTSQRAQTKLACLRRSLLAVSWLRCSGNAGWGSDATDQTNQSGRPSFRRQCRRRQGTVFCGPATAGGSSRAAPRRVIRVRALRSVASPRQQVPGSSFRRPAGRLGRGEAPGNHLRRMGRSARSGRSRPVSGHHRSEGHDDREARRHVLSAIQHSSSRPSVSSPTGRRELHSPDRYAPRRSGRNAAAVRRRIRRGPPPG